jgi:DNA-binding beta-propeller fold protein YncE
MGELRYPRSLAVDQEGRVYVADAGNRRIDVFESGGRPLGALGESLGGADRLIDLDTVATAPGGEILALARGTRSIHRFSTEGQWLGKLPGAERLDDPRALAVGAGGAVLVVDASIPGILVLGHTAPEPLVLGGRGDGPGQFRRPVAIAAAPDGSIYVLDGENGRVQRFDTELAYLGEWRILPLGADDRVQIAVSPVDGSVYIPDPSGGAVRRFTAEGEPQWLVAPPASGPWHFGRPRGVAVSPSGDLYVLDEYRDQVLRFDISKEAGPASAP